MRRVVVSLGFGVLVLMLSLFAASFAVSAQSSPQSSPQVTMLNQAGEAITTLTDGALVRFSIEVAEAVNEPATFSVHLDRATNRLANCNIPSGERTCTTVPVGTLGWYWEEGEVMPVREILVANAALARWLPVADLEIFLKPRPVVLVHGFGSDYTTWLRYLGPSGFLALAGLKGYAVGDGQVAGTMHTGSLLDPSSRTNTIAGNAAVLGEYIANVKALTGAEEVDLVVHSMGGLISRYYIDRLMEERDVAQLIMLGTPNGGSNCAVMLGSLGLYEPAGLELREDYIRNVFNVQITEKHGIPFYNFAGTPIQQKLFSPCSPVPNDLVVSLDSAAAAPVELAEVPILHIDLTTSEDLFTEHVLPLLRRSRNDFDAQGAQASPRLTADEEPVQYSQVYTGLVTTPEGNTHVINIDNDVAVASFGLYDPSRTLTVTVRGASGNVIALSPITNGLTIVDDPESLIYLGYGFENPNPGPWQVTVHATPRTPPLGTEYAIVAQYAGGASIEAALSNHLPGLDEEVEVSAALLLGDEAQTIDSVEVRLLRPDGTSQSLAVTENGDEITASFQPEQVGVYAVDISMSAVLPDGTVAQRSSYLALEAFEEAPEVLQ
jgi:pimeloyl-ACP methyl ester carboxylesterase